MDFMKLDIQLFASGTISLGTNGYLTGQIIWSSTSNGTNANTSTVSTTLQLRRTNSATTTGTWTGNISINGDSTSYSYYGGISSSWVTVSTKTLTVAHNSDGTKTCNIGGSGTGPSGTSLSGKTVSNSSDVMLDKIPRQASLTNAPDFNDEQNPTITYTNPAGNSVTSLQACISYTGAADISYRDIPKTGTSYTFNLTEAERNLLRNSIPNSNSRNVTFSIRCIIGSTVYHSTLVKTFTIVNANPLFYDFDFNDINSATVNLTGNSKKFIKGYSTVQVSITTANNATAQKYATMSKYRYSNGSNSDDVEFDNTQTVTVTLYQVKSDVNNVYAIDSRNNTTLVTKLATELIDYENIFIDKQTSKVERNNNQIGTAAVLTINGTFWNGDFGNAQNEVRYLYYQFKKTDSDTWITGSNITNLTIEDNTFSFEGQIASDNPDTSWDLESSYDIRVIAYDKLSYYIAEFVLNSAIPTMSIDKEGVGIMCAYDPLVGGMLQLGGVPIGIEFSTSEVKTYFKWIDGRTIYTKVIEMGYLGNATAVSQQHGISDANIIYAIGRETNGTLGVPQAGFNDEIYWNATHVYWNTKINRSTFTAYVMMIYTKNSEVV